MITPSGVPTIEGFQNPIDMPDIIPATLYGGPLDGESVELHREVFDLKARVEVRRGDAVFVYGVDDSNRLVWLPDPEDPRVGRGVFVCDDDGKVISEEPTVSEAMEKLDELDDEGQSWKFE